MGIYTLFVLQIIAHLLADYAFQSKKMAKSKAKKGFKSNLLKWHILTVFITSAILALDYRFLPFAILNAGIHWIIDGLKPQFAKNKLTRKGAFFIDQILHIITFITLSTVFYNYLGWTPLFSDYLSPQILTLFAIFLFCTKPANIVIGAIFKIFKIKIPAGSAEDLPNAGRLIGITERWLVVTFIIIGQFSAVGFLITAKSILRFKEGDYQKTEYVLIGTMLSFALAIASALFFNLVFSNIL